MVPFAVISLVWVIPFAMYYFHFDAVEVIKRYVLGTSPNQLWFLLMLFFVFMIFYPLTSFFEKHNVGGAIVALAIYGIGLTGSMVLPNVFQILTACQYLPLFWLGFKIRQYGSKNLMKIPSPVWIAVTTGTVLIDNIPSIFPAEKSPIPNDEQANDAVVNKK